MGEVNKAEAKKLLRNLKAEEQTALLYKALAEAESNPERREVLEELGRVEDQHARHWREKLSELGVDVPPPRPGLRVRILGRLAKWFGASAVAPVAESMENMDMLSYLKQPGAEQLAKDEKIHARVFSELAHRGSADIARAERWHRLGGGGSLRAAVFGMNDGLVSNLSLVMAVAGAQTEPKFVLLAGLAGLLAGAFSMAAGEYVSVRAQRELFENQLELEKEELELDPEAEKHELILIYRAKGVPKEEASRLADLMMRDREIALDTLAREELGLDPEELGSPWGAAISSFVAFAIGAILPVLPYAIGVERFVATVSVVLSAFALLLVGALIALFTGQRALRGGLRMLLIGMTAAFVTYMIGRLVGVSVLA